MHFDIREMREAQDLLYKQLVTTDSSSRGVKMSGQVQLPLMTEYSNTSQATPVTPNAHNKEIHMPFIVNRSSQQLLSTPSRKIASVFNRDGSSTVTPKYSTVHNRMDKAISHNKRISEQI
mmetsp:Transcript_15913/g.24566  ORF Transcript_15913/g.24566 Transcript_15913/m.24566 type:complete len:120 (-) Transcript_15913:17-376(-)